MFKTYAGVQAGAVAGGGHTAADGMSAPGGWNPSVLYMLALVIGEIIVAGWLSRHLLG